MRLRSVIPPMPVYEVLVSGNAGTINLQNYSFA
jgi:hypothetical protein